MDKIDILMAEREREIISKYVKRYADKCPWKDEIIPSTIRSVDAVLNGMVSVKFF